MATQIDKDLFTLDSLHVVPVESHKQLKADLSVFLAKGGRIIECPVGATGLPPITLAAYQMERHGINSRYKSEGFY